MNTIQPLEMFPATFSIYCEFPTHIINVICIFNVLKEYKVTLGYLFTLHVYFIAEP